MAEGQPQINVVWQPHPGSQTRFLTCPAWEILYEGTRGPGKTDALLMKFAQFVGRGYGQHWRGIIFRQEYKQLDDVIAKSKRWFRQIFPGAKWLKSKSDYKWVFPDGEELLFRHMNDPDDYWNYHGHEYPFIGWEELTNWPTDGCYESMKACSRSSYPGMPRIYASTANPFGPGHGWVKEYFIDIGPPETVVRDEAGNTRVRIHGNVEENKHLIEADPQYIARLDGIKNDALRDAWRHGSWDIVVGGFLQGIWDEKRHFIEPFKIPDDWPRWRAGDWGFARPYSIGWYTINPDGQVFRYRELYGYGDKANVGTRETAREVAKKVLAAEKEEAARGISFKRNPMDSAIFHHDGREKSIAELFREEGVVWVQSQKGKGSRVNGAQVVIQALNEDKFFVFNTCKHWKRTVPILMPDPNNWEDVDTEMEDHAWDETRYSLVSRHRALNLGTPVKGPKPWTFDWLVGQTSPPPRVTKYRV